MTPFETQPLEQVAVLFSGGTPRKSDTALWSGKVPWLTPKDMGNWTGTTEQTVSPTAIGNGTKLAPENACYVAVRGMSLHNEIRVIKSSRPLTFNQDIKAIAARDAVDPTFLYYSLVAQKPQLLEWVTSAGHGTGVLETDRLKSLPIPIIPRSEQSRVAGIFASLDDKIELNRRMNETLEAMAQAIFRDWFVDFGPTRRKLEGATDPVVIMGGLVTDAERAQSLADLFPASLGDEGLPLGWRQEAFSFLMEDTIGGDWGKEAPEADNTHPVSIIRGTDFPDIAAGGVGKVPLRYTTIKKAERRKLAPFDILVEVSGGSPTQPTGRSIFITQAVLDRFQSDVVCASFCRRFRAVSEHAAAIAFVHLSVLYQDGGTWKYQNQSTGISNFQTTHFLESEYVIWPGAAVARAFAELVHPMFDRMYRNENLALSAMRDFLLPKLMSGEIRLGEAEDLAEAAQ